MLNLSKNESIAETSMRKYQDDSDFAVAFKNLLRPVDTLAKKKQCEPLKYDLIKELDSFLIHLRVDTDLGGSIVFVEAALMIQNVILIYQKRVDELIDVMVKLIGKFRAYRINDNIDVDFDAENEVGNKKKKKEKKVKFYSSFEPIKEHTSVTLKKYDCKVINLSKKPPVQRIVLNANIKVDNKYSKILPYISIGNGDNIGKKYDYMINFPLNRDLAVNEEFDCPTNEDPKSATPLNYRKSTDPLPMNLMEVDDIDEIFPSTPDPVIFDQTVTDEFRAPNAIDPANILNVSKIPQNTDDNTWDPIINANDNNFADKPLVKKKGSKKEDGGMWLPTYTVAELTCQLFKLKSGLYVDNVFRQLIHDALEVQRSEIAKIKKKRIIEEEKERFDYHDKEIEEKLKNGEEPGFIGFESPIHDDNDLFGNVDEPENEEPIEDTSIENFQSYQKNALDMQKHEQNQIEMMDEQLKMRQRVQEWHNNLRPILEEEEKRIEFDVHEYGTRILSCFEFIGEKKLFRELVGGLDKEEVARYFLSLLMMVNTYNLEITNDIAENDILITLLKKERHHEELQVNIGNQVNQEQN